jgi:uncharacterized protein (UPF0332 family)
MQRSDGYRRGRRKIPKAPTTYQDLVERRLIQRTSVQPEEVVASFEAAVEELSAANLLLRESYPNQAFRLAVESMVMSAIALTYSEGYRPRRQATIALVQFVEVYLGQEKRALVDRFDYFRQHRNTRAFYVMGRFEPAVEPQLAKEAIETAKELLRVAKERLNLSHQAATS